MRRTLFVVPLQATLVLCGVQVAFAQSPTAPANPAPTTSAPLDRQYDCPPGVDPKKAPLLGESETSGSGGTLSQQLSESRGVVCPPSSVDPGIVEPPPAGGTLRVIPPPNGDVVAK